MASPWFKRSGNVSFSETNHNQTRRTDPNSANRSKTDRTAPGDRCVGMQSDLTVTLAPRRARPADRGAALRAPPCCGSRRRGAHAGLQFSLNRDKVLGFMASQPRCIRSDGGLCELAPLGPKEIGKLGHEVKLVPPIYVKPFVKRQKNDATDAEAILRGGLAADDAFRRGKDAGAAVPGHAVPHAGSAGSPAHADDQRVAGPLRRVRRRRAARACARGAAGGGD